MKVVPYASVVGSLMYVMLCTRLDICFTVEIMSRYQSNLDMEHWTTIKHSLKYLRIYWCNIAMRCYPLGIQIRTFDLIKTLVTLPSSLYSL